MKNKKGKKLSFQKIKIAQLNQNGLRYIKGGTGENPIDFSATLCKTDTCPNETDYCTSKEQTNIFTDCDKSDHKCRSVGRDCVGY